MRRLIGEIGVNRGDVRPLGLDALSAALAARSAFLSEALRPAGSTERWRDAGRGRLRRRPSRLRSRGVAIVAADNETEEALALAIAMRETLETPGKTAALVTPDPSIARRVAAELARWGVEVEDSAGRTLGQSPAGALARLMLDAAIEFTPRSFLALLAHPAARFGRARAEAEARGAGAWSSAIFRAIPLKSLDDLDAAFAAARDAATDRHAHPAVRARRRADWQRRRGAGARCRAACSRPCARLQPSALA